jgi:hypothetical protein
MESLFTEIYETSWWGDNKNPEYKGSSGGGSDVEYNINTYVPFLKKFITENNIKSVVDLGCGDFRCGPFIYNDLDVTYTGYDTYKKVIVYNQTQHSLPKYTFVHLDFYSKKEDIVGGDLCILKDVIQHWSLDKIYTFLDYLVTTKKFKYILICNCCDQTYDNADNIDGRNRALSCKFLPLRKYNAVEKYRYDTKEVSVIEV